MSRWRKKPVEIEAFRWTGGPDQTEDPIWIVDAIKTGRVGFRRLVTGETYMVINTFEGNMIAHPGDWIIRGIKGELYPCEPAIFAATYEPIAELDNPIDLRVEAVDFWFVWSKHGHLPRFTHHSEAAAVREAERLARKHPGRKFIVLRAIHKISLPAEQKEPE